MKRLILAALCAVGLALASASQACARVTIHVDLDTQRMRVVKPDGESVVWKISSGRDGYETPTGAFTVQRMDADHLSDEYDGAPMPCSIFFSRGLAIHGTYERGLGRPASHGCIRLSVPNARQLYSWVEQYGATIEITGEAGGGAVVISGDYSEEPRRRRPRREAGRESAAPFFYYDRRSYTGW
jgi:lipoprotein-anchoring transpeptidase ErfK/SrfK